MGGWIGTHRQRERGLHPATSLSLHFYAGNTPVTGSEERSSPAAPGSGSVLQAREFYIDNLMVRIVMIRWTGLAPRAFEIRLRPATASLLSGHEPEASEARLRC